MEMTFDIVTKSSLYNIAREYQGFSNVLQGGWGRGWLLSHTNSVSMVLLIDLQRDHTALFLAKISTLKNALMHILPPIFVNLSSFHTSFFSLSKKFTKINRYMVYPESSCNARLSQIWPPFLLAYKPLSRNMLILPVTVPWKAFLSPIQPSSQISLENSYYFVPDWVGLVCLFVLAYRVLSGGGVLKFGLP